MKKTVLTALIALSLSGCAGAPELTPYAVDTQLMIARRYEVIDKKNLIIKFVEVVPIETVNGFFAIPWEQASAWRAYCLREKCTDEHVPTAR